VRVTNYGKGGQVRNDLEYWNNVIVLRGREGCEMRGTGFFSDVSIKDLVFHDNVVKVIAQDEKTTQAACIAAHGHCDKPESLPVVYRNNALVSNICHVRFGDAYGKGHNHQFLANRFLRVGDRPDYHTFAFGGAYYSWGHAIVDCEFGKGTGPNDVVWQKTASKSWYAVKWTVAIATVPGAQVTIRDKVGKVEFEGQADDKGALAVPLTQRLVHPPTWPDKGEAAGLTGVVEEPLTPHEVTVEKDGKTAKQTVTVDGQKRIEVRP